MQGLMLKHTMDYESFKEKFVEEGDGSGIMLRDRLRKLMADWGSHPAAPSVYEEMEDERL